MLLGGYYYLPFRNSSCGKVMFSQACVKNSVHGGACVTKGGEVCVVRGACVAIAGMHGKGKGGHAFLKGGIHGKGVCVVGGMHGSRGMCGRGAFIWGNAWQGVCMAGETATGVDGMHPTGMHSCFYVDHTLLLSLSHEFSLHVNKP